VVRVRQRRGEQRRVLEEVRHAAELADRRVPRGEPESEADLPWSVPLATCALTEVQSVKSTVAAVATPGVRPNSAAAATTRPTVRTRPRPFPKDPARRFGAT
jgi:hypothetical protein